MIDYYTNLEIVSEPSSLRALMDETENFLSRRDSLPVLEECTAEIQAASTDERLNQPLRSALVQLGQELDEYRGYLGYQWVTPDTLNYAHSMANTYRGGEVAIEDVITLASQVRQEHPIARMSRIRALTGTAKWQTGSYALQPRSRFYRWRRKR